MSNSDSISRLLLRATKKGLLEWAFLRDVASGFSSTALGHTEVVGEPMVGEWEGKCFRLYEYRYKYWYDEGLWEWSGGVALELVAEATGALEAELKTDEVGWSLLRAAREQAASLDDLAASLTAALKDDS